MDPPAKTKGKKKQKTGSEKHRRRTAKALEHAGQAAWFWRNGIVPKLRDPHQERRAAARRTDTERLSISWSSRKPNAARGRRTDHLHHHPCYHQSLRTIPLVTSSAPPKTTRIPARTLTRTPPLTSSRLI